MSKVMISKKIGEWDDAQNEYDKQILENAKGEFNRMINKNEDLKKWKDQNKLEIVYAGSSQKGTDIDSASDLDVQLIFDNNGKTLFDNKKLIHSELKNYFGENFITKSSIAFRVDGHENRKSMDVVVMKKISNTETVALKDDKDEISYFNAIDVKNINNINKLYNHRYSKMVRTFKGIKQEMKELGKLDGIRVPSFAIECCLYAVKHRHYNFKRKKYTRLSNDEQRYFALFNGLVSAIRQGILCNYDTAKKKKEINQQKNIFDSQWFYDEYSEFHKAFTDYLTETYLWK